MLTKRVIKWGITVGKMLELNRVMAEIVPQKFIVMSEKFACKRNSCKKTLFCHETTTTVVVYQIS